MQVLVLALALALVLVLVILAGALYPALPSFSLAVNCRASDNGVCDVADHLAESSPRGGENISVRDARNSFQPVALHHTT